MTLKLLRPLGLTKVHTGQRFGRGLVFGKFMPPTDGHRYFIEFAKTCCYRLTIMVCALDDEPIPGMVRYHWMKAMYPDCDVVLHDRPIPQYPDEAPDFFNQWADAVRRVCGEAMPDAIFASERYGYDMAAALGCQFVPVDERRELVTISGTEVRRDPLANWEHLHPVIRPYFVRHVAVVGPESCGKSTLAANLAQHYKTCYAAEYARGLLASYGANIPGYREDEPKSDDMATIARGQLASVHSLAQQANRVLFSDTDLLTTVFWSGWYFGQAPAWVEEQAVDQKVHLTLLLDPRGVADKYVPDIQRPMPDLGQRVEMFDTLRLKLIELKRPFVVVDASTWEARAAQAVKAVDTLLAQPVL